MAGMLGSGTGAAGGIGGVGISDWKVQVTPRPGTNLRVFMVSVANADTSSQNFSIAVSPNGDAASPNILNVVKNQTLAVDESFVWGQGGPILMLRSGEYLLVDGGLNTQMVVNGEEVEIG